MKIAICLYGKFTGRNLRGEIQGFQIPYKYLKKNVLNCNTDIFIHGWNDDYKETKKLLKITKPKNYIIEKQKKFYIKDFSKLFLSKNNNSDEINNYIFNSYSRFYSLKKAVSLVDNSYDIILISRFDCIFYKKINFNLFNPKNFYTSHWNFLHQDWGFNDAWFISGNKNMKNFSLIYDNLNKYYKLKSNFFRFLKKKNLQKENFSSGHAIWRYRIEELNLNDKLYAYGLEYLTWGLLRRINRRYNPWGRPTVDINYPIKVNKKFIHKQYTSIEILNKLLYKIF
jgi:hypothetical protein